MRRKTQPAQVLLLEDGDPQGTFLATFSLRQPVGRPWPHRGRKKIAYLILPPEEALSFRHPPHRQLPEYSHMLGSFLYCR